MAKKRHGAEQIIPKLREAKVKLARGLKVPQVCKKLEVTEPDLLPMAKEVWRPADGPGQTAEGSGAAERSAQEAAG